MIDSNSLGLTTDRENIKLRHPASHTFLSESFRKLRGKPSHGSPLCPTPPSSQSRCSLSHFNIDPDPTESSLILLSRPESMQVPDSGPLPTYLAQLSGIHYVRDPNQDPDLDADSPLDDSRSMAESETSMGSPSEDLTGSILPTLDGGLGESNGPSESECSSYSTPSAQHDLLHISPANVMSQPQLSPRTCKAAFPPIDLESPYAPYAPTPPLSPPSMPNLEETIHKSRLRSKTLRRLPSTVSIFRKDPMGHRTQRSLHSIDFFKPRSQASSIDVEGKSFDFPATPQFPSTRLRTDSRGSTTSGYSYASTNSLNGFRRPFGFGVQQHCPQPHTPTCTTTPEDQQTPNANRTINSKLKGINTLLSPIRNIRTYASLNNIFKARNSHSTIAPTPLHSTTNNSPVLDSHSALLSPDSGYEILDSVHFDLASSKFAS